MKKLSIYALLMGLILGLSQCSPKTATNTSKTEITKAFDKAYVSAQFKAEDLAKGKTLFETKCVKCHKLIPAETKTVLAWNPILDKMIPKAQLSVEEGNLVRAYAIANAQ